MIIKSIRVKNFLSYEDSGDVEFDRGTTVMIGENGAGKTAIIDGIIFSLFGKNERTKKLEDLQKKGTSKPFEADLVFEEGGKVYRIKRSWGKGKATTFLYLKDGEEKAIADGISNVTAKIEEILELDSNTMVNTIYLKQGEIEGLLSMKPAQRKEMIDRLLGINKFENAHKLMRELLYFLEEKRNEVTKNEELTRGELNYLIAQEDQYEERIRIGKERIKTINSILKKLKEEKEELETKLKKMKEKEEKSREIEKDLEIINEKIREKGRIIEEFEELNRELEEEFGNLDIAKKEVKNIPLLEELKNIKNNIVTLSKEQESLEKEGGMIENIAQKAKKKYTEEVREKAMDIWKDYKELSVIIERNIDDLEKKIRRKNEIEKKLHKLIPEGYDYENYLHEIEKEIGDLKREKEKKNEKLGKSRGNLERYEEWIKSIENVNQCPLCGREFDETHSRDSVKNRLVSLIEEEQSEVKALEKELGGINSKIKDLESIERKLRGIPIEEFEGLKKDTENLKKIIDEEKQAIEALQSKALNLYTKIKKEIDEIEKNIEELKKREKEIISIVEKVPEDIDKEIKRLRVLEKRLQELEIKERNCNDARKERDNLVKKKKEKEEELMKIGYDKEEHEKLEKEIERIIGDINKLIGEKETKEKELEEIGENLKGLIEKIESKESELDKIEDREKRLENLINELERIRKGFNKDNIPKSIREIAIPAIERYAKSYASQFNFGISDIKINGDFSIDVYFGDRKFSLEMLSGGQKTAMAIALRLGIARYLGKKLTSVIMDEPTANLDEERRVELVELLREFMENPESLAQLIIVTHHRELEQIADTLYRVRIANGTSSITEEV